MPMRSSSSASVTDISLGGVPPVADGSVSNPDRYAGDQSCVHEGCVVPCCPHRIGRTYVWCFGRNPYQKVVPCTFITGPDFPCMCCTYALICVPTVLWCLYVLPALGTVGLIIGSISTAAVLGSFTLAACSDPGIIPPRPFDAEAPIIPQGGPRMSLCTYCNVLRPPGAVHCHDCKVCVLELDHHCPWTGKCIGKRNLKFFYAFLITLCTHLAVVLILTIWWMSTRTPRKEA